MTVEGSIHRHGTFKGMSIDGATHTPGAEAVYLGFEDTSGDWHNVELTVNEAIELHGYLSQLAKRVQGRGG